MNKKLVMQVGSEVKELRGNIADIAATALKDWLEMTAVDELEEIEAIYKEEEEDLSAWKQICRNLADAYDTIIELGIDTSKSLDKVIEDIKMNELK